MSNIHKMMIISLFIFVVILPVFTMGAEFADWSADFTHPYFSAWHPGFTSRLYGTDTMTNEIGWRQYSVEATSELGGISCLPVHYTTSSGYSKYMYLAQDTGGNIRLLQDGTSSFLSDPPIFFSANSSDGTYWRINYFTGERRFSIAYHDNYNENSFGYGPYEDCLYVRHYWDGALTGLAIVAPRIGFVQYDGRDIDTLNKSGVANIYGIVKDAWSLDLVPQATVSLEGGAPRTVSTNAEGYYQFLDVPQQNYTLRVNKELYEEFSVTVATPIGGSMERNVNLIPRNGAITGTVTDSQTGNPITNATIMIDHNEDLQFPTDSEGVYYISEARVGERWLDAWADNYNVKSATVTVIEGEEVVQDFELVGASGSITGFVKDANTLAPISNATIQVDSDPQTAVQSGPDGAFRLDASPGVHELQAWGYAYLFHQQAVEVITAAETDIGDIFLSPTSNLLPPGTDFTFDQGTEGWVPKSIDAFYDRPAFSSENGSLALSPYASANCFGYWESPRIGFITGKDYRVRFTLRGSLENPEKLPTVRLRVNCTNSQTVGQLNINSSGQGETSPGLSPVTYDVCFTSPPSAAEDGIFLTFDVVNIGVMDDSLAWIYLDSVEIEAVKITPE